MKEDKAEGDIMNMRAKRRTHVCLCVRACGCVRTYVNMRALRSFVLAWARRARTHNSHKNQTHIYARNHSHTHQPQPPPQLQP